MDREELERRILDLEVEIAELMEELKERRKELKRTVEEYRELLDIEGDDNQTRLPVEEDDEDA